jgi:predicted DCC family thiol-disulfide oxidoreductase YuxK
MEITTKQRKNIVYFDGVCTLCNTFIDFVIKRDARKIIFYASLQSAIADAMLHEYGIHGGLQTIYFQSHNKLYHKSRAVGKILLLLGRGWRLAGAMILFTPAPLADAVYSFIARNRYRFCGMKSTCRIPEPKEIAQFLS